MIQFNQDGLSGQTMSSKTPGIFYFLGRNFGEKTTLVTKGTSCGCTKISGPETLEPNEEFQVVITIDKINQSGYFAESAHIKYGEKVYKFSVSGMIRK